MALQAAAFRAGYVAIVGRPNVGKSTLLNRLVGHKISITSRKPQTTRQRVVGIQTLEHAQLLYVDTPGYQTRHAGALNRQMNRVVTQVLADADVVVWLVEATRLVAADHALLELLPARRPVLLAINKIDLLAERKLLLPFIGKMSQLREFAGIVPVSAARGDGLDDLATAIARCLPERPAIYGADEITESNERSLAAELIREKVFRLLGEELPYSCTVLIDHFAEEGALRRIHATIIVDKESHKGIVVGAGGSRLKKIATQARLDMEKLFGGKVHLEVWVKARPGWSEDRRFLQRLGYG